MIYYQAMSESQATQELELDEEYAPIAPLHRHPAAARRVEVAAPVEERIRPVGPDGTDLASGGEDDEGGRRSRPIRRQDVYRHDVRAGREQRGTPWQVFTAMLKQALTSKGEREEAAVEHRLRRPAVVSHTNIIAVVGSKGGVGKTTTSMLIGDASAYYGRVNTCVIDANPDSGTLGSLVPDERRAERDLSHLLADYADGDDSPNAAELRPYLSALGSGLRVLPAPADPKLMAQMKPSDYERLLKLVERQTEVVILDCGTGITSDLAEWAMRVADQVLVVTTRDFVTANNVSAALRYVPAEKAMLVMNMVEPRSAGDGAAVSDHFALQSIEHRYELPHDPLLRTMLDSGTYSIDQAVRPTRLAIKRLAAEVGERLT